MLRCAAQVGAIMTLEVLPGLLMALPAAQGGFILSFRAYAERLQELGLAIPDAMPVVLALAATTFLAALGTVVENTVSAEEVVRDRRGTSSACSGGLSAGLVPGLNCELPCSYVQPERSALASLSMVAGTGVHS